MEEGAVSGVANYVPLKDVGNVGRGMICTDESVVLQETKGYQSKVDKKNISPLKYLTRLD